MGQHIKNNLQTLFSALNLAGWVGGMIWFFATQHADIVTLKEQSKQYGTQLGNHETRVTIIETRMGMRDAKQ